jgi:hypothetical protein
MPVAGIRCMGSCNGATSVILTPRTSMQCNSKARSSGRSSRGEGTMPHIGHRCWVHRWSQQHCQCDPDAKDLDMVQL